MKSIYFYFTFLVTVCTIPSLVAGNCQPEELAPHPYLCERFFICDNGEFVELDFPPGLYFNPNVSACDWPENVNCTSSSTTPSWNSTTPNWNVTTPNWDVTTPNWNVTTPSWNITTPNWNITTPNWNITTPNWNVTTPNWNITTPNWNVTTPNWNITTPNWNVTTPNWNVTTPNWNITTPNLNITTPNWNVTTPSYDTTTSNSTFSVPVNPTGTTPNFTSPVTSPSWNTTTPNWNTTTPSWNTTTSNSTFSIPVNPTGTTPNFTSTDAPLRLKCSDSSEPATVPHPNCEYFFKCANGYAYEIKCQDGLVWNQVYEYCDYPENSNCVDGLAPPQ